MITFTLEGISSKKPIGCMLGRKKNLIGYWNEWQISVKIFWLFWYSSWMLLGWKWFCKMK